VHLLSYDDSRGAAASCRALCIEDPIGEWPELNRDPAMRLKPWRNAAQYSQPISDCAAGAPGVHSAV
jgi:hypothetical protein